MKMDPPSTNKQRTPSRCREWERQRRLKFNDAISKLGEIVKSINKTNSLTGDEADNVQYPKIEIVQKAIICLTNCVHEKTQLKAEILALEVKLEAIEKKKTDKKDVSLQVTIGTNKKNQNSKYVKLLMLNKSKHKNSKEKEKFITAKSSIDKKKVSVLNKSPPKLPKLLPLTNVKKENTIVMLPATPYIFPQRPVLFPQAPTIVLVDTNLQPINKSTIPIINRNSNDITKTTMVNVLPISAYSHPLSAKTKKNNVKSRNSISKRGLKKVKSIDKKDEVSISQSGTDKDLEKKTEVTSPSGKSTEVITEKKVDQVKETSNDKKILEVGDTNILSLDKDTVTDNKTDTNTVKDISKETTDNQKVILSPKSLEPSMNHNQSNIEKTIALPNQEVSAEKSEINISNVVSKNNKLSVPEKIEEVEFKSKDNKIHAILDTTICENVVDVGNARLELAEEFLAASPTAAFLMSFPLVSGNRADSPAEEAQNINAKETTLQNETTPQQDSYFEKPIIPEDKIKPTSKPSQIAPVTNTEKSIHNHKYENNNKSTDIKSTTSVPNLMTNENPFLSLPLPSVIPSSCALTDSTFGIDFDISVNKTVTQPTTFNNTTNNIFYKGDPFNTVKSTIYSTSSISSGHEFNGLGLYPCAMENYASKNKSDYTNVDDNLMKRLTYDIDLGWSHKSFDFVNCTTNANTFHKDNILTNTTTPFSSAYNPFNPDFHVPLVPNSTKKNSTSKTGTFPEPITSFYNQGANLWSDDVSSIYTNSNVSKNFIAKQQNYFPTDHLHTNMNAKISNTPKQFYTKHMPENSTEGILKSSSTVGHHITDKYTKKSPNKMHINWMTSEIRPVQNNCNQNQPELKETIKAPYTQNELGSKKHTQSETNYFPINMHNFPSQPNHEEHNVWPTTRPAGTTEISMEPPPINLPTLVGDLALGPHDKKKAETINRTLPHTELPNCGNFLSVTQLMNRSSENMPLRPNGLITDTAKSISTKQNISHNNDVTRKSRMDNHPQICYGFNDPKSAHTYESINSFSQAKTKSSKPDKSSKTQKNSYSAESLIRGGTNYSQKLQDNSGPKFMVPQKYNDFNISQESGVAQVSHFPPIIDYSDNSYAGQQFSGTTLYNSTTNTISNSFYTNFMPGSSNLMTSNYTGGAFPSDFVDYNQSTDCNSYSNHKYSDFKMRNNIPTFPQEKDPANYKSSRRESAAKHKLECSKKDSNKKYQSKRPKLGNNEVEEWNDTSHLLWQNKTQTKRHQNIPEEITFSNYVGNQMPTQYQPDIFNSHIMQSNMQNVGPNTDRSLSSFPVTSRANFNLSALFPEITMKVQ
ncbi:uncharacterized protein LOC125064841 [Vanessa atalanta]|uniref:uncharacterized protein LOC125064841 n=1 Tax=Vanessa atalanta TaxID=42275 RepID=UPI001FCD612D|nr:uncharacterized protein LOC125064841 [Vanessa atalanta]